jgi:hypothetical protein
LPDRKTQDSVSDLPLLELREQYGLTAFAETGMFPGGWNRGGCRIRSKNAPLLGGIKGEKCTTFFARMKVEKCTT